MTSRRLRWFPDLSDEALVKRTRAGDVDAFEVLVERHRELVYRVARRIVGPDDADDITQDAFLRAFHRLGQFRGESPFQAWLLRITHNTALNALDRQRPHSSELPEQPRSDEAAGTGVPAQALEESERRDRLASKLRLLTPRHRTVLVLRDLEGLSYEEIAAITDAPLGSVKGRLHRARAELIELLRHNLYDWELPAS